MADISKWSNSAGGNATGSTPDFPVEGWSPSSVNDTMREQMAAVRRWYEDAQWVNYGDSPVYASATTFSVAGNLTSRYEANRRIKCYVGSNTYYGTITSSTFTTASGITISLDSGALTSSLSAIAVASLTASNPSMPVNIGKAANASTLMFADISGTAATATATVTPTAYNIPVRTANSIVTSAELAMTSESSAKTTSSNSQSLDLGTVTSGDRILITGYSSITGTGTPTYIYGTISKIAGTATVQFVGGTGTGNFEYAISQYLSGSPNQFIGSGTVVVQVTGSGTLTLRNLAAQAGVSAPSYDSEIYAFFLKKQ